MYRSDMEIVLLIIGVGLAAAWVSTLFNWIQAVLHRKPEVQLTKMLFSGLAVFDPDNFTAEGQRYQRRYGISFAVFFLLMFLAFGVVAASGALAP